MHDCVQLEAVLVFIRTARLTLERLWNLKTVKLDVERKALLGEFGRAENAVDEIT